MDGWVIQTQFMISKLALSVSFACVKRVGASLGTHHLRSKTWHPCPPAVPILGRSLTAPWRISTGCRSFWPARGTAVLSLPPPQWLGGVAGACGKGTPSQPRNLISCLALMTLF